LTYFVAVLAACAVSSRPNADVRAGVIYEDPAGGWTYLYTGELVDGDPFEAMDGTWSHENGSDEWDGSAIGEPDTSPGGVSSITEDTVTFARFQDTGDPRNDGFPDPGSNRKIYVTHDITDDDPDGELLLSGVTLTFRTRLGTTGLLDGDVPEEGDGYYILDNGKSSFSIRSENAGVISFAPATSSGDDLAENATGALLMNSYAGDSQTDVDTTDAGEHREFPLDDPTAWNEFWITISEGPEFNEFLVDVYANGSTTPESFIVSAGDGNDAPGSYIAMGAHSTGQSGVIDVDFFGFKPGIHVPTAGGLQGDFNANGVLDAADIDDLTAQSATATHPAAYDLNSDALVDATDIGVWVKDLFNSWIGDANLDGEFNSSDLVGVLASGTYEADVDSVWSTGDFNGDGRTNSGDLVAALADGGYEAGPAAAVAAVPEPGGLLLSVLALSSLLVCRRR
jgi:hypothetical protein